MGGSNVSDGMGELIHKTNLQMKGSPSSGVDEAKWLVAFIEVRRSALLHAQDPSTRKAWVESVDRFNVYKKLLTQKNFDLNGPLEINVFGGKFQVP